MDFNQIYKNYYKVIFAYNFQLTRCVNQSKDLTQEVFEKLYTCIHRNQEINEVKAWLYKVSYNLFNTQYKRKQLFEKYKTYRSEKVVYNDFSTELEKNEREQALDKALSELKERDYHIIVLYRDGLSYEEMADVMQMNKNSVGKTLARAIEKLKVKLKNNCYELFE